MPEEVFEDKETIEEEKKGSESDESDEDEEDDDDLDQPISLKTLFHSIIKVRKIKSW